MAHLLTVEFVRFPAFEKSAAGLLSEVDILDLEMHLAVHPHAGDLIPGGRGLRKLRRPAKGRASGAAPVSSTITSIPDTSFCSSSPTPKTNRKTSTVANCRFSRSS
jgi:hypothetical protein